jgi:N-acetylglucosamine kinase-like BadF-type ATPase
VTRYVLGVDGGGSRTRAAITDDTGRLLGSGEAGPSNFDDVGVARARENIAAAVAAARAAAGVGAPFAAAFLGLAGVVSERDRETVRGMARDLGLAPPEALGVDHDCRIALAGGLAGRPGVVLIVGTGSSCYGRDQGGRAWRSGGWGSLISDEGSSYWLSREALRAAVRALDGRGPDTVLAERLLAALGVREADDLMHRLYLPGLERAELAALAPIVVRAAHAGDRVARDLVRRGAGELAECVQAVAAQLGFGHGFELVVVGGLAQAEGALTRTLTSLLARRGVPCTLVPPELPPVLGACLLGRALLARHRHA